MRKGKYYIHENGSLEEDQEPFAAPKASSHPALPPARGSAADWNPRWRAVNEAEDVEIVEPRQNIMGCPLVRAEDGREWFCAQLRPISQPPNVVFSDGRDDAPPKP